MDVKIKRISYGLVLVGAAMSSRPALAYNVFKISASGCQATTYDSSGAHSPRSSATLDAANGLQLNRNYSATQDIYVDLICPVPDDSYFPKNTVTGIYADVYNVNGISDDTEAQACVTYVGGGGGTCGSYGYASAGNGYSSVDVDLPYAPSNANFIWRLSARAGDYPFVLVTLGSASSSGAAASLQGIYMTYN